MGGSGAEGPQSRSFSQLATVGPLDPNLFGVGCGFPASIPPYSAGNYGGQSKCSAQVIQVFDQVAT